MRYLNQICNITIAVFLTAMVVALFPSLTSCRGESSKDETVRWIPVSQDTIPDLDIQIEDSLELASIVDDVAVTKKPTSGNTTKKPSVKHKGVQPQTICNEYTNATERTWLDEFGLDSIELTITTTELELQITQSLNR